MEGIAMTPVFEPTVSEDEQGVLGALSPFGRGFVDAILVLMLGAALLASVAALRLVWQLATALA